MKGTKLSKCSFRKGNFNDLMINCDDYSNYPPIR